MTSVLGEVGVVFDLEIKYLLPDSSYQLTLDATPSLPPTSNRIYKMKIALLLFSTTWVAPYLMNCKRRHRPIDKQKSVLSLFSVFFKMENRNKCHLMGGRMMREDEGRRTEKETKENDWTMLGWSMKR